MISLMSFVGARSELIKASILTCIIKEHYSSYIKNFIVDTGEKNISKIFANGKDVVKPDVTLLNTNLSNAGQISEIIRNSESLISSENPSAVIICGGSNTSLGGAIAASKLNVPVIQLDAGVRCNNKMNPEEINRILSDHIASYLFASSANNVNNLFKEGYKVNALPPYNSNNPGLFNCGDIMYEVFLHNSKIAEEKSFILESKMLVPGKYILVYFNDTCLHNVKYCQSIFSAVSSIALYEKVRAIMPVSKSLTNIIENNDSLKDIFRENDFITYIPEIGYSDMLRLIKNALITITNSESVKKEALLYKKKCLFLDENTEAHNHYQSNSVKMPGQKNNHLYKYYKELLQIDYEADEQILGDGFAGEYLCRILLDNL